MYNSQSAFLLLLILQILFHKNILSNKNENKLRATKVNDDYKYIVTAHAIFISCHHIYRNHNNSGT